MKINISMGEAFTWFGELAKQYMTSPIPNKEKVTIVIRRLEEDVDTKRQAWQHALAEVMKIDDPDRPEAGNLTLARRRLQEYEHQGQAWGAELSDSTTPQTRKLKLESLLEDLDSKMTVLESEIGNLEQLLVSRQETLKLCEGQFQKAKNELKKLRTVAPTIIAQTEALEAAQRDKMKALEAKADGPSTNAGEILAGLQSALGEAKALNTAAASIEESESSLDVDAEIVREKQAKKSSERLSRWCHAGVIKPKWI